MWTFPNVCEHTLRYTRSIASLKTNWRNFVQYRAVGCNNKSFVHCAWSVINWPLKRGTSVRAGWNVLSSFWMVLIFSESITGFSFCTNVRRNCLRIVRRQEVGNVASGRTSPDDSFNNIVFKLSLPPTWPSTEKKPNFPTKKREKKHTQIQQNNFSTFSDDKNAKYVFSIPPILTLLRKQFF